MRSTLAKFICLAMLLSVLAIPAALSKSAAKIVLPAELTVVSEESFSSDTSLTEVEIPATVTSIEARAFSGCTKLRKVSIFSPNVQIAKNAFQGCSGITLYVYKYSTAEAFARKAGINYAYLGSADRPTYLSVKEMIGQFSASGTGLMGGDDRIIVKMYDASLPDISEYKPVRLIEDDRDTYFIQFESEDDASKCRTMLTERSDCAFAEFDSVTYVDNRGEDTDSVSSSGILTWKNNDDPMGFDVYAPYVVAHQSGSQMIAIIDTGVEYNPVYADMLSSKSINMLDDGQDAFYSGRHHATHIAGIIHDCVGEANVKILSIRAVDDEERTDSILFGQSIAYAVDSGADIINISYLFPKSSYVEDEIRYAVSKGVKVVIAAGNENGKTSEVFPANANVDDLIVVSGLDDGNKLWSRTNTGPEVTYCAPASGIRTSVGDVGNGTSFAAPMIAAAHALVDLDTTHTIKDMRNSCKSDISIGNKTQAIGYGMPQLHKLAALKVTKITVANKPSILKVGESYDLAYTVKPKKAEDRTVNYSSSDTSVLTITAGTGESLVLKGKGKGKSTVTITAHDGSGVSNKFDVQVVQPVTKIKISADSLETDLENTIPLKLSVKPNSANNKAVRWSSSKKTVATVSEKGVVTPVAEGTTVIRAEAKDGYGAHAEVTIRVVDVPEPVSLDIIADGKTMTAEDTIELQPGKGIQLNAKISPEKAVQTVAWSAKSVPSGAVTVDSTGYVKAVSAGTAFVTATSTANGALRQEIGVIVQVMPTGITVSGASEVKVGETIALTAVVAPDNATDKSVVWSVKDSSVASITQSGVVKGLKSGETDVVATAAADSGVSKSKHIVVKQMPKAVSITGTVNIFINNDDENKPAQNASQLTATVSPADTYDKSVTWSSSNTAVAKVSGTGLVETVAPGTTVITATSNVDSDITATVTVTVKNKWGGWTGWSESPVTKTDSRDVQTRIKYQYRDTHWTGWQKGSPTRTDSEVCSTETNGAVYEYYSYYCPNCGRHWPRYDKGCSCGYSANFGDCLVMYWEPTPFTKCPYISFTGASRYVLNSGDEFNRFFSHYSNGSFVAPTSGYRYKLWNGYQYSYNPVSPVNTNDYTVEVKPITVYRYRDMNSF